MSRLSKAVKKTLDKPFKMLIWGQAGIGKTTLACGARNAIVIDAELGSTELDVARYPFKDANSDNPEDLTVYVPDSHKMLLDGIRDIAKTGKDLGYETCIIDSVNIVQKMICAHILTEKNPKKYDSIGDFPYGNGPGLVLDVFHDFLAEIDLIVAGGLNVIMIGHEGKATVKNPGGADYDIFTPGLQATDKSNVCTLLNHHCDIIAYVHSDVSVREVQVQRDSKSGSEKRKGKVTSKGRRIVELTSSPVFRAKARPQGLPEQFELPGADEQPWTYFQYGIEAGRMSAHDRKTAVINAAVNTGWPQERIDKIRDMEDMTCAQYIAARRKIDLNQ